MLGCLGEFEGFCMTFTVVYMLAELLRGLRLSEYHGFQHQWTEVKRRQFHAWPRASFGKACVQLLPSANEPFKYIKPIGTNGRHWPHMSIVGYHRLPRLPKEDLQTHA